MIAENYISQIILSHVRSDRKQACSTEKSIGLILSLAFCYSGSNSHYHTMWCWSFKIHKNNFFYSKHTKPQFNGGTTREKLSPQTFGIRVVPLRVDFSTRSRQFYWNFISKLNVFFWLSCKILRENIGNIVEIFYFLCLSVMVIRVLKWNITCLFWWVQH